MAKQISDEKIKLSIIINGDEAQKELLDLEKGTRALNKEQVELRKEKQELQKQLTQETAKTKAVTTAIRENAVVLATNKAKVADLRKEKKALELAGDKESDSYKTLTTQIKENSEVIKANKLRTQELYKEKQALQKQALQESDRYREITTAIKDNNTTLATNKARMGELQKEIGITGLTMNQLRDRANQVKFAMGNMLPGSEDFKNYKKELDELNAQMGKVKGDGEKSKFSLGGMADGFNRYGALFASFIAGLTGVVLSIQKVLDWNGQLADSQTKVQKTTGMTKREVDELTKSFGLLKTRTGRIELLGIAEIGGRLGIAKEEIKDFVKVMDKSAVALGDSFEGGPDVVAEKLGRIKGLYAELRDSGVEEAFESVGSALNDLGAAGTASEQNLAEFAQRVGSLPDALKPSIQQALGLGAAFEESGLKAELAGNNYGKVISIAARDFPAFAKIMQRSEADVKSLINTNPTEFFLQFAQSLKGLDATQLAQVLDYLKLNDNEVKMVLGAASQNVDLFRDKINLAGQSMADATSLTTEYDLVNNNLAATMERLKKKVTGWFTSDSVVAFITSAIEKFAQLVGAVEDNDGVMTGFKNTLVFTAKVLAILITGFVSYSTAAKLAAFWSNSVNASTAYANILFRIQYAQLVIQQVATKGLALAQALLSGNITRVKAAYQALTVVMGMNPFGALLAVIGAVVAAFVVFNGEADQANKLLNVQAELQKDVADQTLKTKTKINELIKVLKDENSSIEQKEKALTQLQKISNGYLDGLTKENVLTAEGIRLINRYVKSIDQLAAAKAMVNLKTKLNEQKLETDNKILGLSLEKKENTNNGLWFTRGDGDDGKFLGLGSRNKVEIQSELEDEKINRTKINSQIAALTAQQDGAIRILQKAILNKNAALKKMAKDSSAYKELVQDIRSSEEKLNILIGLAPDQEETTTVPTALVPAGKEDKAAAKAAAKAEREREKEHKRMLAERQQAKEDLIKYQNEVNDLEQQAENERISLLLDGFDKEDVLESTNHKRKIAALKKQLVDESEVAQLDAKIDDPKASKMTKAYWMQTKETWVVKNKHINSLIQSEESRHQLAVLTIAQKAENKRLADLDTAFNKETVIRQTAHNYELAALGENQIAKELLQQEFDKEELDRQTERLNELIASKEAIMADKNSEIDFDLLTPEQKQAMDDEITQLKLKISELLLAKQALANKGGTDDLGAAFKTAFGNADVLGFTADQWGQTFASLDTLSERLQATAMVVGALQNMWGKYNEYVAANEAAQLSKYEKSSDVKKRKLKQQLDNGYINQVQYKNGVESLDADLEKKKAELEYKQAKRQKAIAAVNILMSTAQAIMGIWAQFPKADFGITAGIMSGVVGALGALQLATVMKTPLPAKGYEQGLYPEYVKREQDGKMFKSTYGGQTKSGMVNKPTYFLAGENGPEMVIDSKAYRQMSPETKNLLIRELRGIKGFEKGYYNNDVTGGRVEIPVTPEATGSAGGAVSNEYMLSVINRNSEILEKIYTEGIVAMISRDPRELKKLQDDMDRIKNSKTKAQV